MTDSDKSTRPEGASAEGDDVINRRDQEVTDPCDDAAPAGQHGPTADVGDG